MKRLAGILSACCTVLLVGGTLAFAATPGALRPTVQENFRHLLETGACPSCDLTGVDLTRVDLHGANLEGANLVGAKMFLANLAGANLRNANLQGAALGGADLANADLRGANLAGVILEGAYLKGALMDGQVIERKIDDSGEEIGAREQVYRPDERQPKTKPYTQEVLVEDRRDFGEVPPAPAAAPKQPASGESISPSPEEDSVPAVSKKLVPMEEAVVPQDQQVREVKADGPQLKDSKKVAVENGESGAAALGESVSETPAVSVESPSRAEEAQDQEVQPATGEVRPDSRVDRMISQIEGTPPAGKEETGPTPSAGEKALSAGPKEGPGEVEQDAVQVTVPEEAPAAVPEKVEKAVEKVRDLVYTVETPQEAQGRKLELVERLLDDNRCLECDLSGVDLSGEDLEEADLERAHLQGARLKGADLSEANLKGADLRDADLREADLREADLYQADLRGADLTGARLEKALLDSADLDGVKGLELPPATE